MGDGFSRVGENPGSTASSLIASAKAGDAEAWSRLATLYGPMVYRWARGFGLQPTDARDVAQDVFRNVHAGLERFEHERPNRRFRGWLWTITRNEVRQYARRLAKQPLAHGGTTAQVALQQLPEFDAQVDEPDKDQTSARLAHRAVELIRAEFEPNTWQAFWRTAVDGQPSAVVAEELGMSDGAVRQAKYRVLGRLREMLTND